MKNTKSKNFIFYIFAAAIVAFFVLFQAESMASEISDIKKAEQMTDEALKNRIQNYLDMIESYNNGIFCIAYESDGNQQVALSLLSDTNLFNERITIHAGSLVYNYSISPKAKKYRREWDSDLKGVCFGKARVVKILSSALGTNPSSYDTGMKVTYEVAYEGIPDLDTLRQVLRTNHSDILQNRQSIWMTVNHDNMIDKNSYVDDDNFIKNWFVEINKHR